MAETKYLDEASFAYIQILAQEALLLRDQIEDNNDVEDYDDEDLIYESDICDHPIDFIAVTYPIGYSSSKFAYYRAVCTQCHDDIEMYVNRDKISYKSLEMPNEEKEGNDHESSQDNSTD